MNQTRSNDREWEWSPWHTGAIVGSVTAILLYILTILFFLLTTNEPIGTTPPFTTLTGRESVFAPIAVIWTLLDAHWVHPSVVVKNTGTVIVIRDVLWILGDRGESFGYLLRIVPPLILVVAGAFTSALLRRKTSGEYGLYGGAVIAVGYAPLLVIPGLLARVPVAPNATGDVQIGSTIFDAPTLAGVTAHPGVLVTVFAGIWFPAVFGAVGAWISTFSRRLLAR